VTDPGGNLLGILEGNGLDWHAMPRTNKKDLHPLWFGIYDDVVYHHGAGFRRMISRVDLRKDSRTRALSLAHRVSKSISERIPELRKMPGVRRAQDRIKRAFLSRVDWLAYENRTISDNILKEIKKNYKFYECFL
jgi:hypothetical protein